MSGLGFSLSSKRPAPGARPGQPKKPVTVQDLFGGAGSDDEDAGAAKRSRGEPSAAELASRLDKEVVEVASKLADFVAKNGDQYETMTRERNPGEGPFKFLHDKSSLGYRFYAAKVRELKAPAGSDASASRGRAPSFSPPPSAPPPASRHQSQPQQQQHHQPRSAPYPARSGSGTPQPGSDPLTAEQEEEERRRAQLAMAKGDAVAAMEAFAALAAKRDAKRERSADPDELEDEERRKRAEPLLNKTAFERRKTTAVYKDDGSRGHHMGDYIPKEVLVDFMAKTGDQVAQAQAKELEKKDAIGSDNIGHKLLQKMGWREGDALGGTQKGITQPIKAAPAAPAPGEARGLGATAHGEVSADDDPYEAYRKRMMLGYKYRPNPLGNPRRAYY